MPAVLAPPPLTLQSQTSTHGSPHQFWLQKGGVFPSSYDSLGKKKRNMYNTACFIIIFLGLPPTSQSTIKINSTLLPHPKKSEMPHCGELWSESIFLCNILAGLGFFTLPQHTFPSFLQNSCSVNPLLSQAMKISSQTYKSINKPERRGEKGESR